MIILSVIILRRTLNFFCQSDEEEDQEATICGWAYNAEKIIHGNPSGIQ
jgi:hypothetical protein